MANIELVIKIPEEVVTAIQNGEDYRYDIHTAIAQGTPLPRGHGDLVDRDTVYHAYDYSDIEYTMVNALEDAPTIIEADKTESEE